MNRSNGQGPSSNQYLRISILIVFLIVVIAQTLCAQQKYEDADRESQQPFLPDKLGASKSVSLNLDSFVPSPIPATSLATDGVRDPRGSNIAVVVSRTPKQNPPDLNHDAFYKNKIELSLEAGYMEINVPFMFDFLLGDDYTMEALRYTLVPLKAQLRWQMGKVSGPLFLRGSWDATCGGTITAIPRGPESRYFGYTMGLRRNFISRRWRAIPYIDGSVGIGNVDAQAPRGFRGAQGQDLTFTIMIESGVRYQINSRYAFSLGAGYMHISNLYLSEPKYPNYGINVVGPMISLDVRLRRNRSHSGE